MADNAKTIASQAAVAAANWWAEAIGSPTFDNGGDPISGMLAGMLSAQHPVDAAQTKGFAQVLASKVAAELDRLSEWGYNVTLDVDYGPGRLLAEAARDAKVSGSRFPWKTCMWVHADHVTVSAGYRAQTRLVWASDEWEANRPPCDTQQWDESKTSREYHGEPFVCSLPLYHEADHHFDQQIPLCAECGHRDGWYHGDDRSHMPDFHAFVAEQVAS